MSELEVERIIKDFLFYFDIKANNISLYLDKIPGAQVNGEKNVQGLRNLVSQVISPVDPEYDVIQDQWVEYALIHLGNLENPFATQVLKDLNGYITDKVYFGGVQAGPVDILLYYLLYNVMLSLTFQEKEKFLHFSRWFNNMQQNGKARSWRSIIPFSKTPLYL